MTSANVTYYTVTDRNTHKTFKHSQNCMCKDRTKAFFAQFTDPKQFEILVSHPDEEECDQVLYEGNLAAYLSRNTDKPLCPTCLLPLRRCIKAVDFADGSSPIHVLTLKVRAEWCSNPECNQDKLDIVYNEPVECPRALHTDNPDERLTPRAASDFTPDLTPKP